MRYMVGNHEVDHLPVFLCRRHRDFLSLSSGFVKELIRWAERGSPPMNYKQVGAETLEGDEWAFEHSDYLLPAKIILFNPRGIRGHGALPLVTVQVDRRFFGIPASYLRRRIFDDCEQCLAENNPASDVDFPDYSPPEGFPMDGPPPGAPPPAEIRLEGSGGRAPRSAGTRGSRRPPPRRGPGRPPGRGGPPARGRPRRRPPG